MAFKKVKNLSQDISFILIILGFVAAVNYLATWWFGRLDLTANHVYSISPATRKILRGLDDIISVKVYFSRNLPPQMKTLEADVHDLLAEYKAFGGNRLHVSFEDPSKNEETKRAVRELGIPEVQLNTYEKDKQQAIMAYVGIAVLFADKKEVLPVVQDMRNFEYDLTQAIMKVNRSSTPKVAVLKTDTTAFIPQEVRQQMRMMNQEDPTQELYKPVFDNLKNNYTVELVSTADGQRIDSSFKTLIVPGGANFSDRDIFEIDQFFMGGGTLIVLVDAVKVSFQYGVSAAPQETKLLGLLEHYGARVERSMVLDVSCGQVQVPQRFGNFQIPVARDYPYFVAITPQGFNRENPAVAALGGVIMPWVSPITLLMDKAETTDKAGAVPKRSTTSEVLVRSSPRAWLAKEPFDLNPDQQWKVPAAKDFNQYALMVHLSGAFQSYFQGKPVPPVRRAGDTLSQIQLSPQDQGRTVRESNAGGHLVIAGDAEFLSGPNATQGNTALLMNIVDWLTLNENLIGIRTRAMVDRVISQDRLKEGSSLPSVIRWLNILTMPALLVVLGLLISMGRREAAPAPAAEKTEEKKS
jgi:ABC-2 type transport system permease protein